MNKGKFLQYTGFTFIAASLIGFGVIAGADAGHAATPKLTTQESKCVTSFEWIAGQQKAAHIHITKALPSNATALKAYPQCTNLSPQILNVVVGGQPQVKALGAAVYTHWHNVK